MVALQVSTHRHVFRFFLKTETSFRCVFTFSLILTIDVLFNYVLDSTLFSQNSWFFWRLSSLLTKFNGISKRFHDWWLEEGLNAIIMNWEKEQSFLSETHLIKYVCQVRFMFLIKHFSQSWLFSSLSFFFSSFPFFSFSIYTACTFICLLISVESFN